MVTHLRSIFLKPVERQIDGVIKADDTSHLGVELDEYVLTNEIEKSLESFLEHYNTSSTSSGAWISGFFGSGKSHLLKMLALVLSGRDVGGAKASEVLAKKAADNTILAASLRKAASIPSDSILFNIDQKADVNAKKSDFDALLGVFQKVFDEHCGYYGKQAYVAQLERDLDRRGEFAAFRAAYDRLAGKAWETGREQALLEGGNVARAYREITGDDDAASSDILKRYREDYRLSVESFVMQVASFLDGQGPAYRLNFFVDEVGQYIADNVKLMTNLQTIAETLHTRCGGRSWIVVTAQQDIQSVIGDLTSREENDFSKIQARFAHRMPLNSADVAEVIQKRLLAKTNEGQSILFELYGREANNLRTLFGFGDNSLRLREFRDKDHFVNAYPFIPYQFELFQQSIQSLSDHNAFQGRHSSVGERSMLAVFQEVAKAISALPVGEVAPFDAMFDGLRAALKASAQRAIQLAENNLGDAFAVRILKALFLVKYVRGFKATSGNIAILVRRSLDEPTADIAKRVDAALTLLEQQTYVQRNGDLFEYLTDEEKDIEEEIKAVIVDNAEIGEQLHELLFEPITSRRTISHPASGGEYGFSKFVDGQIYGKDSELHIRFLTPFGSNDTSPNGVRMESMNLDALVVLIAEDKRFMDDVLLLRKTEKYFRQNASSDEDSTRDKIINAKAEQNAKRRRDIQTRVRELTGKARLFVRGEEIETAISDPRLRIEEGFKRLIDKVYTNLSMLQGHKYSEADVEKYAAPGASGLFGSDEGASEAQKEIVTRISREQKKGIRVTAKSVLEIFERAPYGWPYPAILCQLAALCARGSLDARLDSDLLSGRQLAEALKNNRSQPQLILETRADFKPKQVKTLRDFYQQFFDEPPPNGDAKPLGEATASRMKELKTEVESLKQLAAPYPFADRLAPVVEAIAAASGKGYDWYLTDLPNHADMMLDLREDPLAPIRTFMKGPQRGIHDDASEFLKLHRADLDGEAAAQVEELGVMLADAGCYRGKHMQDVKSLADALKAIVGERRTVAETHALGALDGLKSNIEAMPDYSSAQEQTRSAIASAFDSARSTFRNSDTIAQIRDVSRRFQDETYPRLVEQLYAAKAKPSSGVSGGPASGYSPAQPTIVRSSDLKPKFARTVIESEADVDAYVDALRASYVEALRAGRKILL